MRSAREAFIQSESSEKINRALRSISRSCSEANFGIETEFTTRWRGPGSVIGQENKQVLVKHGSEYAGADPYRFPPFYGNRSEFS